MSQQDWEAQIEGRNYANCPRCGNAHFVAEIITADSMRISGAVNQIILVRCAACGATVGALPYPNAPVKNAK